MSGELMSQPVTALVSASMLLDKSFNLDHINFQTTRSMDFILQMCRFSIPCDNTYKNVSHGTISFDLVTLISKFDLLLINFNLDQKLVNQKR